MDPVMYISVIALLPTLLLAGVIIVGVSQDLLRRSFSVLSFNPFNSVRDSLVRGSQSVARWMDGTNVQDEPQPRLSRI